MNYYEIFNEGAQSANTPLNDASPVQKQMIQDKIAEMPANVANRAKDFLKRNWKWLTVGAAMMALAGGTAYYYNRDRIANWYNGNKVDTPPTETPNNDNNDDRSSAWNKAWEEANAAKIFDGNKSTSTHKPEVAKSNASTTTTSTAATSVPTSGSGLGGVTGIGNMGQFKQEIAPTNNTGTNPEVKITSQANIPSHKGELNLGGTVGADTFSNISAPTNAEPPKLIDGQSAVNIQNAKDQIMNIISDPYGNKFTEAERVQAKLKDLGYTDRDLGLTWDFMKGYFFEEPK